MIITGKDGKQYNTVKECLEADKRFDEAEELKQQRSTNEKKELADKINKATERYNSAVAKYKDAKEEALTMVDAAIEKAKQQIAEAKDVVQKALKERAELLDEYDEKYNKKFTVKLTGREAIDEFNKMLDDFNIFNVFKTLF